MNLVVVSFAVHIVGVDAHSHMPAHCVARTDTLSKRLARKALATQKPRYTSHRSHARHTIIAVRAQVRNKNEHTQHGRRHNTSSHRTVVTCQATRARAWLAYFLPPAPALAEAATSAAAAAALASSSCSVSISLNMCFCSSSRGISSG